MIPTIKVVLVGDSSVGKTSIIQRFVFNKFKPYCPSSSGVAFITKILGPPSLDFTVSLTIWDTAGQEKFRSLITMYYKDASAIIAVYDVSNKASFEGLKTWVEEIKEKAPENTLVILVGNKTDLIKENDVEDAEEYADKMGCKLICMSAKENINVEQCFEYVANSVVLGKQFTTKDGKKKLNGKRDKHARRCC